jgi:hypothetical protein
VTANTARTGEAPYFHNQRTTENREIVMLKSIAAVLAAAAIAGVLTSATSGRLDAGPLPAPVETALKACTQAPWPYLNCVGTPLGNPRIRVVKAELTQ